jgi:predicted dehydrogenase
MTTTFSLSTTEETPLRVLNAGVIGFGFIGEVHVRAIRASSGIVQSIAAKTLTEAQIVATRMDIPKAVTIEEMISDPDIDVIHICTPNVFHAELSALVINAGKNVICEKPFAITLPEAEYLSNLVVENKVIATVPFIYRFHPIVREARSRISKLKEPLNLLHGYYLQDWLSLETTVNWRIDPKLGGPSRTFADIGIHWCDLMEFVTGHRITAVNAQFMKVFSSRGNQQIDTEDGATMIFRTDKGAQGSLVLSQVSAGRKNKLWFSFESPTESFVFDQEAPEGLWIGGLDSNQTVMRGSPAEAEEAKPYSFLPAGHAQGFQDCFNSFIADSYRAIGGAKVEGLPTFADGLRAAQLTNAVIKSSKSEKWVEV